MKKKTETKVRNEENAQAAFERASRVIGADKAAMSEECRAIALRDFTHVALEYFDLKTPLKLTIESGAEGGYAVSITFRADRAKPFYILK